VAECVGFAAEDTGGVVEFYETCRMQRQVSRPAMHAVAEGVGLGEQRVRVDGGREGGSSTLTGRLRLDREDGRRRTWA